MLNEWNGFNDGVWTKEINVRNFIQKNYTLYEGDDSFLADDLLAGNHVGMGMGVAQRVSIEAVGEAAGAGPLHGFIP